MMTTHKNQTVEQVETSHDRFIHKNRTGDEGGGLSCYRT